CHLLSGTLALHREVASTNPTIFFGWGAASDLFSVVCRGMTSQMNTCPGSVENRVRLTGYRARRSWNTRSKPMCSCEAIRRMELRLRESKTATMKPTWVPPRTDPHGRQGAQQSPFRMDIPGSSALFVALISRLKLPGRNRASHLMDHCDF